MLKAIAIIAIVLAAGIAGVLAFALTKPDTFRVEREPRGEGAGRRDLSAWSPISAAGPTGPPMKAAIPP